MGDAEAVAQRRRDQAGAGGGADHGERRHVEADGAGARTLADDDVQLVILHGRVEHFLDGTAEAVDLVDEEDVALLEVGEDGGDVGLALERRAGSGADGDAHLAGDDAGQRGLAQAGRADQQHVVERLVAGLGRLDEDLQLLLERLLADEIGQLARTQRDLDVLVLAVDDRVARRWIRRLSQVLSSLCCQAG